MGGVPFDFDELVVDGGKGEGEGRRRMFGGECGMEEAVPVEGVSEEGERGKNNNR